ncbi:MAG: hypothetical protein LT070_08735 [Solirubrobacteraceae bacterium]|nr:hypothetical protein [Solirubrobacteraceae bacterium]
MRIASNSHPAATTSFFLPGTDARQQESEYGRLRLCARRATGTKPSDRRIRMLACRHAGRDCTFEVGQADPVDGVEVIAILDLGRHLPYCVFTKAQSDAPTLLIGKPVYVVSDFE